MSNFLNCLADSKSAKIDNRIREILYDHFGNNVQIIQNLIEKDDKGIDYIVIQGGHIINIDVKIRNWAKSRTEDIVLEYKRNIELDRPGWSTDDSKLTDYILWYWTQDNQFYFADFKKLCRACKYMETEWLSNYGRKQYTDTGYHSLSAFVPIKEYETAVWWNENK